MPSPATESVNFNFFHEIGKGGNYLLLYPQPQAGLAILALYQKVRNRFFPNGQFKESDIYQAFEASKMLIGEEEYDRLPQTKFNNMISDLQVYFLRYDADEQVYTLKDYAYSFCRHAEETLLANFNPTKIEMICNHLRDKLEKCHTQQEVVVWIDTYFDNFKPVMKLQVDQLERQVDRSVQDIRETRQAENNSIIDVLKAIDTKLDVIRHQNVELRSAFTEMKSINRLLDIHADQITSPTLFEKISGARQFFPELKYTLNLIDKRLDRIQPKLRQFFGILHKPTFNVRIEKFLKFLLSFSSAEGNKVIQFPEGVPVYLFHGQTSNLPIVERKEDLFPTASKPRSVYRTDIRENEQGTVSARKHLAIFDETQLYLEQILAEAARSPE